MAKVKGHLGIAQFSRPCPICGKMIEAGSRIAKQMVDGKVIWMHERCWTPGGPDRYARSLDRQFRRVIGGSEDGISRVRGKACLKLALRLQQ